MFLSTTGNLDMYKKLYVSKLKIAGD